MTDLRTAAQQALEVMKSADVDPHSSDAVYKAMDALKAALVEDALQKFTDVNQELEAALAEDVVTHGSAWSKDGKRIDPMSVYAEPVEPVAWYHVPYPNNGFSPMVSFRKQHEPSMYGAVVPLYLAPPQRKPLSEAKIKKLLIESAGMTIQFNDVDLRFARAIERAHGIGEQP